MTRGMAILQARKLWPKHPVEVREFKDGTHAVGYQHLMGPRGAPGTLSMFMMMGTGDSWQAAVDEAKAEMKRIEELA